MTTLHKKFDLFPAVSLCLALAGPVVANESSAPPLAGLPGQPGPVVEKIKALGTNEWVNLGAPEPDPKWGRARGRSWGSYAFAFDPHLHGAYYTGEGRHNFVKPDGHGMDDYWFYDINAHRWICFFPGTDTRNFNDQVEKGNLKVDELGRVVNREGHPVPGHQLIHAWGFLGYDTHRRQFAWLGGHGFGKYYMPGGKHVEKGIDMLQAQGLGKGGHKFAPWTYEAQTGRFGRELATNSINMRDHTGNFPFFLYIDSQQEFFLAGSGGVAFYKPETRTWRRVTTAGVRPSGYDFGAAYDTRRERVYMGTNPNNFHWFDLKTSTWTRVPPPPEGESRPGNMASNASFLHYDPHCDAVLVFDRRNRRIHIVDPETNAWTRTLPFAEGIRFAEGSGMFYAAELNAYFLFLADDSQDNGTMWVYRYGKAAP